MCDQPIFIYHHCDSHGRTCTVDQKVRERVQLIYSIIKENISIGWNRFCIEFIQWKYCIIDVLEAWWQCEQWIRKNKHHVQIEWMARNNPKTQKSQTVKTPSIQYCYVHSIFWPVFPNCRFYLTNWRINMFLKALKTYHIQTWRIADISFLWWACHTIPLLLYFIFVVRMQILHKIVFWI